jgi:hypothetical protein
MLTASGLKKSQLLPVASKAVLPSSTRNKNISLEPQVSAISEISSVNDQFPR